ncbi:MAG: fumarylacetoacetate hydrolase family protein [Pseudomonadota bacterium]
MRLLRYGEKGQERPCVVYADGAIRDVSKFVTDFAGETVSCDALDRLKTLDLADAPVLPAGGRIGSPLASVRNFYCIGLNYRKHAEETGARPPVEPMLFNKAVNALSGPFDPVPYPRKSSSLDWEVEIGLVIGKTCRYIAKEDALLYVAGYFTANDISERDFQKSRGGQFVKGKSGTNFGPIGPYLVTADEVPDPNALGLTTKVNGDVMQNSNTSDMIFDVKTIISNLSQYLTLEVGDIILTGTPEGVGLGIKPDPVFLKTGDVVEVEVEGLGAQRIEIGDAE